MKVCYTHVHECLCACVVNSLVYLCLWIFGGWGEFPFFSLFLYNAWCAIHYNFMYMNVCAHTHVDANHT